MLQTPYQSFVEYAAAPVSVRTKVSRPIISENNINTINKSNLTEEHEQEAEECTTAFETYLLLCRRHQCRPISSICTLFKKPEYTLSTWRASITQLNLAHTYVGAKGALPLIEFCSFLSQLKQINLSDNYITNHTVQVLCEMALNHPSLHSIELYNNEALTWTGGMSLVNLVAHNVKITHVDVRHTNINGNIAEMLFLQCRTNARTLFAQSKKSAKLSAHPTAIHLRAMKRYFHDVQNEEYKALQEAHLKEVEQNDKTGATDNSNNSNNNSNNKKKEEDVNYKENIANTNISNIMVHKAKPTNRATTIVDINNDHRIAREKLWDGFQECCRNLGKVVHKVNSYNDTMCAKVLSRLPANVERITWEIFFILLLIENSEYSDAYVTMVRKVFDKFNVDPLIMRNRFRSKSTSTQTRCKSLLAFGEFDTLNNNGSNKETSIKEQPSVFDINEIAQSGIQSEGIVEVSAFKEVYLRLFNEMPLDEELTFVRGLLGLSEENTVNWDEFLFVWYMRFPSPGSRPVGVSNTPLHTPKPQMAIQQM